MFFDSHYGIGAIAMLQLLLGLRREAERQAVAVETRPPIRRQR